MCPFDHELAAGKMACDAQFYKLPPGAAECQTSIFDWCQHGGEMLGGIDQDMLETIRSAVLKTIGDEIKEYFYEQESD